MPLFPLEGDGALFFEFNDVAGLQGEVKALTSELAESRRRFDALRHEVVKFSSQFHK